MLSTLAMNEKLIDCKALMNRIVLESIPSGGEKLDVITDAMLKEFKLGFEYIRYGSSELKEHIAEVYGLVLYNQRWYILAGFGEEKKYTFALDRMKKAWMTKEKSHVDPAFDAVAYFDEFYGIYNSGREIMKIVIRAFGDESYYLRDLPIHKSQREIGSGGDYTDFMIELRPNKELISCLFARKNRLKVLSPDCIVEEMKEAVGEMSALYS
jgi:predicted DNA-binding transcriptional regulator YafY